MTAEVRAAYAASARLWAEGPEPVYAELARALLAGAGGPPAGGRVLDLGAGTVVAGQAALAAGAGAVVAADVAVEMLLLGRGRGSGRGSGRGLSRGLSRGRPVVADAGALPFRDGCFDLVVAAFCLGHLPDLTAGLREARRVGARLAAGSFAPGCNHPAKAAVDGVLGSFGYVPPPWYLTFKQDTEPRASDPAGLGGACTSAGFADVRLRTVTVDTGRSAPSELAAWRLGMAHVAPFVGALPAARRAELRRAAESAVAGTGPLVISMLVLTAR